MRIDPEAVYLEVTEGATAYNLNTGTTRAAPAVIVHWKDARRWHRRSVIANDGETLGALLANVGAWIDRDGLGAALEAAAAA